MVMKHDDLSHGMVESVKIQGVLGCPWTMEVILTSKLVYFTYLWDVRQLTYIGMKQSIDPKYQQDIPVYTANKTSPVISGRPSY